MKRKIVSLALGLLCGVMASCTPASDGPKGPRDTRGLDPYAYTLANIVSTDALGRSVRVGDAKNNDLVGIFYFVWNGYHHDKAESGIYDITELLKNNPDALWNAAGTPESPLGEYHYWGQPLYGYYSGEDPWVVTRHVEMLTMAGIDYIILDTTNSIIYTPVVQVLFERLDAYQKQGFNVPKVAFYCNSKSSQTMRDLYNVWYVERKFENLWFKVDERPLIICNTKDLSANDQANYEAFFYLKESQWPFDPVKKNGYPWMDWGQPTQEIYRDENLGGIMSVSLAQHPGCKMSEGAATNQGRGYDGVSNKPELVASGANVQNGWENVFRNRDRVNNVFLTGWNEWIAIKSEEKGQVYFVDTFNEEYSRDIEMSKSGYGDNYYLQMIDNIKRFKYTEAKHYVMPTATVDLADQTFAGFNKAAHYKDFAGDAMKRDFRNADDSGRYVDNSARNDITDVKVIADDDNVYFYVQTAEKITDYEYGDFTWMNVLIKTSEDITGTFAGYSYAVNRKPTADGKTSVEKSTGGYNWETAGEAEYRVYGNVMLLKVPLAALGLTSDAVTFQFKVSDHVVSADGKAAPDIMDYYVTGDSAPIGRLSYSYGY